MSEAKPTPAQRKILEAMVVQRIQEHSTPSQFGGRNVRYYVYVQRGTQWETMTVRADTFTALQKAGWIKADGDDRVAYRFYSLTASGLAAAGGAGAKANG